MGEPHESTRQTEVGTTTPVTSDSGDSLRLKVLLNAKDHADKTIASYMELQLKLAGLGSTAIIAAGGWLFTQDPSAIHSYRDVLVALAAAFGSLFLLQSIVMYGLVLGYLYQKKTCIEPGLQTVTGIDNGTLDTESLFRRGPAARPTFFASAVLAGGLALANLVLVMYGWTKGGWTPGWSLRGLLYSGSTLLALLATVGLYLMLKAMLSTAQE